MNQYWIYILRCKDRSYYTGVCNDIERRFSEHESGIDTKSYTYERRPVQLVYSEEFDDINDAIAREKQIKGWSRAKKKALIEENWSRLIQLSKNSKIKSHPSTGSG